MKKVLATICLISFISAIFMSAAKAADTERPAERKKVGLVLSGGGAKGVAHIGVLKVLEEAGFPIDYIAGTSMGSLIGALYAIGYSAKDLENLVAEQNWDILLSDKVKWKDRSLFSRLYGNVYTISFPFSPNSGKGIVPAGLIKGQNINTLFSELTAGYQNPIAFDSLPIPFACVATNVYTGEPFIFRKGVLQNAMRASMSIPGVFSPVIYNDSLMLVDGGLINNYPVDVVKEMGADITIGVDLDNGFKNKDNVKNMLDIFEQMIELYGHDEYAANKKELDLSLNPGLTRYNMASFNANAIDTMIMMGEQIARKNWDKIIELKKQAGYGEFEDASPHIKKKRIIEKPFRVNEILYEGCDSTEFRWIDKILKLKNRPTITSHDIIKGVNELYATGNFAQISYTISGTEPYDIKFNLERRPGGSFNLGVRFDSEEYAAILLNTTITPPHLTNLNLSLSARLGNNPWGELDIYFGRGKFHRLDLGYKIQYNDFKINSEGTWKAAINYLQHHAFINMANISFRNVNFSAGLTYDYYDNRDIILKMDIIEKSQFDSKGYFTYDAGLTYNNLANKSFPDKGQYIYFNYRLLTDNLIHLHNSFPFNLVSYGYKQIIPIRENLTITTDIEGRSIIGKQSEANIPFQYANCSGGYEKGRYMPQQIAVPGIKNFELNHSHILKTECRIGFKFKKNNYIGAGGNYFMEDKYFEKMFDSNGIWGISTKYSYSSILGPISVILSTSSRKWKPYLYISAGYFF